VKSLKGLWLWPRNLQKKDEAKLGECSKEIRGAYMLTEPQIAEELEQASYSSLRKVSCMKMH
jgi:hypothetical protein